MRPPVPFRGSDRPLAGAQGLGLRRTAGRQVLGTLVGLLVLACEPGANVLPRPEPEDFKPPPVVLESVRFEGYRGTEQEFEVRAERARVRTDARTAQLERVEIVFLDTGRGPLEVYADAAELDLARDDFVLHENVRGETGSGERFQTSEVRYDPESRLLRTDESVSVERGNWSLRGKGMEIDVPGRRLRVLEPQSMGAPR